MQAFDSAPPYLKSKLLSPVAGLRHGFFGAQGGVSEGIYASLNCGALSHDAPQRVAENRALVASKLGIDSAHLFSCNQCHSKQVLVVRSLDDISAPFHGDGLVTQLSGIALSALGADCAPVLFCDPVTRAIGAAHSGWKGALFGINEAVVKAMCELGAQPERILAAIGPAMQVAHYEVQPDFKQTLLENSSVDASACFEYRQEKLFFNTTKYIVLRLNAVGVNSIDLFQQDTFTLSEQYFSYRRSVANGEHDYGRQIAALCLA